MTEEQLRQKILQNTTGMKTAQGSAKALLQAENESLAGQLDKLTGGTSKYDAATGIWDLSASPTGAVDKYLLTRQQVEGAQYGGYDPEKDSAYGALKKEYLREADRGTQNTLAQYAGMTGGIPSTAAVAAAQEQGNYYRGQLADRQVELGNQDYQRWYNSLQNQMAMMELYGNAAEKSAQARAALGDYSEMGRLYGWTDGQIADANAMWLAANTATGGGGGGRSSGSKTTTYDGMTEDDILNRISGWLNTMPVAQVAQLINGNGGGLTASQQAVAQKLFQAIAGDYRSQQAAAVKKTADAQKKTQNAKLLQKTPVAAVTGGVAGKLSTAKKKSVMPAADPALAMSK